MLQCPNCGATVADTAQSCHNCGVRLDQHHGQGHGGQGRTQQGRQQQGGQPQSGQRQPPQGGQQYQQGGQGQPPQGGYQQGVQYGGGDEGLGRREFLVGGGAAVAAAAGGWYFFLRETTPGGPEGVVYDYVDAFENRDAVAMDKLVHQNSPTRGGFDDPISEIEENPNPGWGATVERIEVLNEGDVQERQDVQVFATVQATITFEAADQARPETETVRFVVVKNSNGDWKFWRTWEAVQPTTLFEFDYEANSGQTGDGSVSITLDQGESVEAQELYVQGDNLARIGDNPAGNTLDASWADLKGVSGSKEVKPGISLELEAMSDYEAAVVWKGGITDQTATLGEGEGPDA